MYNADNYDTPVTNSDLISETENLSTMAAKIRYLLEKGNSRSQVAKMLGIRYQWVRNVAITPIKK